MHKQDGLIVIPNDKKEKSVYLNDDYHEFSKPYNNYSTTYSNYTTNYKAKNCRHHGDEIVFQNGGKQIYAAKKEDIVYFGADLVIDLVGLNITAAQKFVMEFQSADEFKDLNSFIKVPKILRLDWKDMSAPDGVPIQFWQALWDRLPIGKTIVCCFGGHGRTGTCIGAFLICHGFKAKDAIKYVRKVHCEHAIETKSQELYLELLELEYEASDGANLDVRLPVQDTTQG